MQTRYKKNYATLLYNVADDMIKAINTYTFITSSDFFVNIVFVL